MKTESLFYLFGGFFAISAIVYFTWEYLFSLSKGVKTILLFSIAVMFFSIGLTLKERGI